MVLQTVGDRVVLYIKRSELEGLGVDSPERLRGALAALAGRGYRVRDAELFVGNDEVLVFCAAGK